MNNQTEEQQEEAIKKFLSENGVAIFGGLVIGISIFVGVNFYKNEQLKQERIISDSYQQMLEGKTKDSSAFIKQGEAFVSQYSDSNYSVFTLMALAQESVKKRRWSEAEAHLMKAINISNNDDIKAIAKLRIARLQVQQSNFDKALTSLSSQLPEAFKTQQEEIKGDIYVKQGKKELARRAYQIAVDNAGEMATPVLQMKLDDLAQVINISE